MNVGLSIDRSVRAQVPADLRRALMRQLRAAGRRHGLGRDRSMQVRLANDEAVAQLHLRFMDLPGPTDVLSFPADDDDALDGSLGDVVIAWPYAVRQSASRGAGPAAWRAELLDLCVHGLAHLLGHDHGSRDDARRMIRLERRLARRASIAPPVRPYPR